MESAAETARGEGTVIQDIASALTKGMVGRMEGVKKLIHNLTKGQLRELFVSNLLRPFLTSQFELGSGVVVNAQNAQSHQTDIVIYDNTILPPFIREQGVGVYPVEGVIAAIEIKTGLDERQDLLEAQEAARQLQEEVYVPAGEEMRQSVLRQNPGFSAGERGKLQSLVRGSAPLHAVLAMGAKWTSLLDAYKGKEWLRENITVSQLFLICVVGRASWARTSASKGQWKRESGDSETLEETKRFIALLLDNIRTVSGRRKQLFLAADHHDWFSKYIRTDIGPLVQTSTAPIESHLTTIDSKATLATDDDLTEEEDEEQYVPEEDEGNGNGACRPLRS